MDVAPAVAFGPAHDVTHVVGVRDPACRDPVASHSGGIVRTVEGELHFQSAPGHRLEHLTLQHLGVVPARAMSVIGEREDDTGRDRKSTRLNSSHPSISYAVFCLKKKTKAQVLSIQDTQTNKTQK